MSKQTPTTLLILGGDSDIGIATAKAYLAQGPLEVVLAGRHVDALDERAEELRGAGASSVEVASFDATNSETLGDDLRQVFELSGFPDVTLICFGVLGAQEESLRDPQAAERVAATNYTANVAVGVTVVDSLRGRGRAAIVFLSSVAAIRARRSNFIYGSSKAGADAFWQGMSHELRGSGLHVTIVRPGFVPTKMTAGIEAPPLSTTAEEVGRAIVEGVARKAPVVWVPSTFKWVSPIIKAIPRRLFGRLSI